MEKRFKFLADYQCWFVLIDHDKGVGVYHFDVSRKYFLNAQAHHFDLSLPRGSCCSVFRVTKPREKLEVDLTHVKKLKMLC